MDIIRSIQWRGVKLVDIGGHSHTLSALCDGIGIDCWRDMAGRWHAFLCVFGAATEMSARAEDISAEAALELARTRFGERALAMRDLAGRAAKGLESIGPATKFELRSERARDYAKK